MGTEDADSDQDLKSKSDDKEKEKEKETDDLDPDADDLKVKYSPEELTRRLMNTADEAKKMRGQRNEERKKSKELEDRLKNQEREKLAQQGKWKEHSETLQKELDDEKTGRKKDKEAYATEGVVSIIQREAMKMGVTDETDLNDLVTLSPWNELEVDENFKPRADDVRKMLSEQRKLRPRLFSAKKLNLKDGDPAPKPGQSTGDRSEYIKEIQACKTQAEFDRVRKKYGHVGL